MLHHLLIGVNASAQAVQKQRHAAIAFDAMEAPFRQKFRLNPRISLFLDIDLSKMNYLGHKYKKLFENILVLKFIWEMSVYFLTGIMQ